jgi:5-methylcytosine-specific restriction endonuclease McrA
MEAMAAWERDTASQMLDAINNAIELAKLLHPSDVSYAYEMVRHFVNDHEATWRVETNTPSAYEIKKRKEISAAKRTRIYERDQYRCVECGTHLNLTIDHIIPVSKDGTNDDANLQTLCKSCNSRKGVR